MKKLATIIKHKNIAVTKNTTIHNAIKTIHSNNEGCVIILDNKKAIGILTERDILSFLDNKIDMNQEIINISKKKLICTNSNRNIEYALHILIDNNIRRLVIVNDNYEFMGIVTQEIIINNLESEHYRVNLKVSQILSNTSKNIITLNLDNKLEDAIKIMNSNDIGSILISEDKKIIGIITERDIVHFVSKNIDISTCVSKIMSTPVVSVNYDDKVILVVDKMKEKDIRRVIVNDLNGNTIGVIGIRDIIKNIKGNYSLFIENKLKYTKQALNAIDEVIFELYNDNGNILIQWGNNIALKRYGTNIIDQDITTYIDTSTWSKITNILIDNGTLSDYKISIKQQHYLLSCNQYDKKNINNSFFIICKDITDYELKLLSLNKNLDKRVKEEVAKNKQQEERFFAQSRLAQMGEMISMIAHQWRQPLGTISAITVNLRLKIELEKFDFSSKKGLEEANKYFIDRLENIENYIQNLTTTIDDFRNFYKPNKEKRKVDFQTIILKAINLIGASLSNDNINIVQEYHSQNQMYLYDNEIMQVILNILKNAQDNFKDKDIENKQIIITTDNNSISICDNGGGIKKDILPHIFDPYFSTKDEKNGTGLGLYMSKTIIQDHHHGKLFAKNTKDGVCFSIVLQN